MEAIRSTAETPKSSAGIALIWFIIGLGATAATYVFALKPLVYGTTWIFWFFNVCISGAALIAPRTRSRLKFFAVLCLSLATIRSLSSFSDLGILNLLSMASLWCAATIFVATAVYATTTTLRVPIWPEAEKRHKLGNRRDALWLPLVLRPVAVFIIPLTETIFIWGAHWSHRSESCIGITVGSAVALACLLPLSSLWISILSLKKKISLSNPRLNLPKRDTAKLGVGFVLVYLWGLGAEWRTTENYLLWSLLILTLFLALLLFWPVSALEVVREDALTPEEARWPSRTMFLYALCLMLLALSYGDLLECILR